MKIVIKMDRSAMVETALRAGLVFVVGKLIFKSLREANVRRRVFSARHDERKKLRNIES